MRERGDKCARVNFDVEVWDTADITMPDHSLCVLM